jgi:glycerol-3-phosphate O-acyltransferase
MLVPCFKSYMDMIILIYIHITYEVDLPFIAGLEEFSNAPILTRILRNVGGFFVDNQLF